MTDREPLVTPLTREKIDAVIERTIPKLCETFRYESADLEFVFRLLRDALLLAQEQNEMNSSEEALNELIDQLETIELDTLYEGSWWYRVDGMEAREKIVKWLRGVSTAPLPEAVNPHAECKWHNGPCEGTWTCKRPADGSSPCEDHGTYCWQHAQEVLVGGTKDNPMHYEMRTVLVCCRCQKIAKSPDETVTVRKER